MRGLLVGVVAFSTLVAATPARAAAVAVNAGVLEVIGLPGPVHAGLYPNVGVSLAIPVMRFVLVPSVGLEFSPELGRGGLVVGLTADAPLSDRVGLDLAVTLIQDMPGFAVARSDLFAGGGVGCSLFFDRLTVSPFFSVFFGLTSPGLSLVPGLNLAWTL